MTLLYRAKKRKIDCEVAEINSRRDIIPDGVNLIFGGGGQDKQQEYVSQELQFFKNNLYELIFEKNVPCLTICGTFQLFGHYFKTAEGREIKGISIFDLITVASNKRKIGNVVIKINNVVTGQWSVTAAKNEYENLLVGFENHSGNTMLNSKFETRNSKQIQKRQNVKYEIQPLGRVIKGFGNNGEDGLEGAIINNCIGTYLHGPILPKNPCLADWLIEKAVGEELKPLDDELENKTREIIIKRILR